MAYGTGDGQTATVAARLEEVIEDRNHVVTTVDIESTSDGLSVEAFDAVLIGSSILVDLWLEARR